MKVLSIDLLLPLHLYLLALLNKILLHWHVFPSSFGNDSADLVDRRTVRQLNVLQLLFVLLCLFFDDIEITFFDVCLIVESACYIFVDAAQVLP